MGKRRSSVAIDEEVSRSKSRKSRRITSLDSDDEEDEPADTTPIRNPVDKAAKKETPKNKSTPKRSKKESKEISTITIDSDSEGSSFQSARSSKKRKEAEDHSHNKDETNKQQISLEKAFALQKKPSLSPNKKGKRATLPVQSNTLDNYFSKNAAKASAAGNSRQEVSVTDFFGKQSIPKPNQSTSAKILVADTPNLKPVADKSTNQQASPSINKHSNTSDGNGKTKQPVFHSTQPKKKKDGTLINTQISSSNVDTFKLSKKDSDLIFIDEESSSAVSKPPSRPESPLKQAWLSTLSPTKTANQISPQGSSKENESPPAPTTPATVPKTPNNSIVGVPTPQSTEKRASYLAFKQREGPRELDSSKIPQGAPNCLTGVTILVTGVLEHIERDDAQRLVERCGGKFTKSISKKTSYLVVGREPGQSKISKADQFGTKILDEDGFFKLIEEKAAASSKSKSNSQSTPTTNKHSDKKVNSTKSSKEKAKTPTGESPYFMDTPLPISTSASVSIKGKEETKSKIIPEPDLTAAPTVHGKAISSRLSDRAGSLPWVEKYRPQTRKQLIGQQGAASCANKLFSWLENWHAKFSRGEKDKAYSSGFGRFNDDGSSCRAALLSGPPGIGKTTTAQVVCRELGFTYVELNASDKRNKSTLDHEIADALKTHSLLDMFGTNKSKSNKSGRHHCILMDEVDGMAGNEDRGGMNQLIQLIKQTKIPIICMCNDRQSMKVRSLVNYCFDLRFQRPRVEQIKCAMLSIAGKESLKLPPGAITDIVTASNSDVRQIINNMEMWSATELTESQTVKDAKGAKKDLKIGPFDVIRKVFAPDIKDTVNDKSDLFFQDYSLGPLFVQENYLNVKPHAAEGDMQKTLYLISQAADAIADGDLVSKRIRSTNSWGLLPVQAIYSSVLPGEFMRGPLAGMSSFPSWLGKNSTQGKTSRQLSQISNHIRLATRGGCDASALSLDYVQRMAEKMSLSMKQCDANPVIEFLDSYHLLKEDMDTVFELATWSTSKDWLNGVDSKTKAALTRAYNKGTHLTPYSITSVSTKRGKAGGTTASEEGDLLGEEEEGTQEGEVDEEDENPDADAMIVKKKPKKVTANKGKTANSTKESKPTTSKKSKAKK